MSAPFNQQQNNPFGDPFYDVNTTYVPPDLADTTVDAVVPAIPEPAIGIAPVAAAVPAAAGPQPAASHVLQFSDSNLAAAPVSGNITRPGQQPTGPSSSTQNLRLPGEDDPSKYPFYNVRRYRPYFDVDTKDVLWRVGSSFLGPFKPDFMAVTMSSPDLYGPFWVATTLIFVTAVAGNYADFIAFKKQSHSAPPAGGSSSGDDVHARQWYADYTKMSFSALLFYGYVFLLGMGLFFALRWFKSEIKLANVWCIYGYAMTIYIPMAFVCILPIGWVRWLVVMLATGISGFFIVANLKQTIYEAAPARALALLGVMLAFHVGLGLALRLYFFRYSAAEVTTG